MFDLSAIRAAFVDATNKGEGFAAPDADPAVAADKLGHVLYTPTADDEVYVVRVEGPRGTGRSAQVLAIGDVNGAWCVDVSALVPPEGLSAVSRADIAGMTPYECWEAFVGNQSPRDFMACHDGMTVDEAVDLYVYSSDFLSALRQEPSDALAPKLVAYIESSR